MRNKHVAIRGDGLALQDSESTLSKLRAIGRGDSERPSLDSLRNLVVDLNLREVAARSNNERPLGIVYLIRKLTNDIWTNLFTDASFDAVIVDKSEAMGDFVRELNRFVQLSTNDEGKSDADALRALFKAIFHYYRCLTELVSEAQALKVE